MYDELMMFSFMQFKFFLAYLISKELIFSCASVTVHGHWLFCIFYIPFLLNLLIVEISSSIPYKILYWTNNNKNKFVWMELAFPFWILFWSQVFFCYFPFYFIHIRMVQWLTWWFLKLLQFQNTYLIDSQAR